MLKTSCAILAVSISYNCYAACAPPYTQINVRSDQWKVHLSKASEANAPAIKLSGFENAPLDALPSPWAGIIHNFQENGQIKKQVISRNEALGGAGIVLLLKINSTGQFDRTLVRIRKYYDAYLRTQLVGKDITRREFVDHLLLCRRREKTLP